MSLSIKLIMQKEGEGNRPPLSRLWGSMVYMAGAIDRCPNGGKPWRDWLTPQLNKLGVIVLDPLRKPIDIGLEDDDFRAARKIWKEKGDFDQFAKIMKLVRNSDLRFVDKADFLIVCLDLSIQATGTYEEIFLSNRQKKPVLIWCPQGKKAIPDWLYGVIDHKFFFNTTEEILEYLTVINTSKDIEPLERWLCIDYRKLYSQIGVFNDG